MIATSNSSSPSAGVDRLRVFAPSIGLVLGSGLAGVIESVDVAHRLPFEAAGLPESAVPGHAGEVVAGTLGARRVAILSGRVHLYEGHDAQAVTAGVRLLHRLGVRTLILTNAAGTLHPDFPPGDWMMLSDHLNLTGLSPLTGGPNFVDLSAVYSPALRERISSLAAARGMILHHGVYAGVCGPQYETPAEVRMLRTLGADAAGMSTVLEAIQAHALGMELAAFSCLTNWAAGLAGPLDHAEVVVTGRKAAGAMAALLQEFMVSD